LKQSVETGYEIEMFPVAASICFSPKTLLARLCRFVAQEVFGMILQNRISKTLLTLLFLLKSHNSFYIN